jgi:uncharacterized CHY-type Zn-finger protein
MKQTTQGSKDKDSVICVHCHKEFHEARFIGLSIICPFCGKPSNELILK